MKTIERGMVLCVSRDWYDHYGVYVGNEEIIHFTSYSSDKNANNTIMKTSMRHFIRDAREFHVMAFDDATPTGSSWTSLVKVVLAAAAATVAAPAVVAYGACMAALSAQRLYSWFETNDYKLYSREECAKRAEKCLGFGEYNIVLNNCEQFSLWCKIGIHTSTQVNKLLELGIEKSRTLKANDYVAL